MLRGTGVLGVRNADRYRRQSYDKQNCGGSEKTPRTSLFPRIGYRVRDCQRGVRVGGQAPLSQQLDQVFVCRRARCGDSGDSVVIRRNRFPGAVPMKSGTARVRFVAKIGITQPAPVLQLSEMSRELAARAGHNHRPPQSSLSRTSMAHGIPRHCETPAQHGFVRVGTANSPATPCRHCHPHDMVVLPCGPSSRSLSEASIPAVLDACHALSPGNSSC